MKKSDCINLISINSVYYNIEMPAFLQDNKLIDYLMTFDLKYLEIIAGFDKTLLTHFFRFENGMNQKTVKSFLKKMLKFSYMIRPTGKLSYLTPSQIEYLLSKIDEIKIDELTERKVIIIGDAFLKKEPKEEVEERELKLSPIPKNNTELEEPINTQDVITKNIKFIKKKVSDERDERVEKLVHQIISITNGKVTNLDGLVFKQMHPDRLKRLLKFLKDTDYDNKERKDLYIEWFILSLIVSKIEYKVEHWQLSTESEKGEAGVYTAGIDFSRYDNIIKKIKSDTLTKILNYIKQILREKNPSKKAIQRLGQRLIAQTGHDEHLYFTQ